MTANTFLLSNSLPVSDKDTHNQNPKAPGLFNWPKKSFEVKEIALQRNEMKWNEMKWNEMQAVFNQMVTRVSLGDVGSRN